MLTSRFEDALIYACHVHGGQRRKGGEVPYASHILGVASLALDHGADEDEAIGALLHDAVEDAGGQDRLADIRRRYGERVAQIVLDCTDADTIPKPPWKSRKETYVNHLPAASKSGRFVSCCDKVYNARTIVSDQRLLGNDAFAKFNGGKEGTLWYYSALLDQYSLLDVPPRLLAELRAAVGEMQHLAGAS